MADSQTPTGGGTVDSDFSITSENPLQNKVISEAITEDVSSKNLINPNNFTIGRLASDGTIQDYMTNYYTSDYILIKAGKTYVFARESLSSPGSALAMSYSGYGLYNTSKVWIANSRVYDDYPTDTVLTITPQTDCYIRVTGANNYFTTDTVGRYILEEGTELTGYEEYFTPYRVPNVVTKEDIEEVITQESLINLYDKTLAVDGKYVFRDGSVYSSADFAYTGLIPVKPDTQYSLSKDVDAPLGFVSAVYEFDKYGAFLRATVITAYPYLMPFYTSADCYFVAVNLTLTGHTTQDFTDTIDTMMLCYGTNRPHTYSPYNVEYAVVAEKSTNAFFENLGAFDGKLWLATGTSLTWYDGKTYQLGVNAGKICRGYIGNVSRRKRLKVINDGISGATLGNVSSNSFINRYTTLDFANTDIFTIEFGVNDYGNDVPVGTASDSAGTGTFAACLKTVIEYAIAQNPKINIVICLDPDVRGTNTNNNGNTLKDYIDVQIAIAEQYRLQICNWYYHSGINSLSKGDGTVDYLTADGTHPNDDGHLRMGAMLNQVFDSLIC